MIAGLATRRAPIVAVDATTRTVTARLVRWNDPRPVRDPNGDRYTETFTPGALEPLERTYVLTEHGGDLIGRMDNHRDDGDGHVADLSIADTAAGRDLLALVDAGVIDAVSIEFDQHGGEATWTAGRDAVTRSKAALHGVAFAFQPAHDAPILSVREETPAVNDQPLPTPTVTVTPTDPDELIAFRAELVGLRDEIAARAQAGVHPLARFGSLVEWADAVAYDGDKIAKRELLPQITTDNPGVIPPGWVQDVKGIVTYGRPAVSAVGGPLPLPDAGMDINWPYFNGTLLDLIGEQATEKTAITSVDVSLLKGTSAIHTFAGGANPSYQLLRRSSPSYREAYMRIMTAAYAAKTDQNFVNGLLALGTGSIDLPPAGATAATALAAIFQASMTVFQATGQPATAVIADGVWFAKLASLFLPQVYGTQNVGGTAQASNLSVTISGLTVTYDPYVTTGNMIVTNGAAARMHEDGPMVAEAEDVEKLGKNIAIWGMVANAVYTPAGVVIIKDVP